MSGTATEAVNPPVPPVPGVPPATPPAEPPKETPPAAEPPKTVLATKPEGDAPKGDAPAEGEGEAKAEIVYDIKAPEGIELDMEVVGKFTSEVAKALNLTNEQAQAIVEFGAKHNVEFEKARQAALTAEIAAARDAEHAELTKDPKYGGANWDKTKKMAAEGFLRFANEKAIAFINTNMLGDRGPMITLFADIAEAFKEDSARGGGTNHPDGSQVTSEEQLHRQMYPSMFKNKDGSTE